mgnify:CR=1 FL=1
MFSIFKIFKKKKIVPHIRLSGIIGSVGRFKQGISFAGQQEIIDKAFSIKKSLAIAISINSPGGSPVQSHLIYSYIKKLAKKNDKKVLVFAEDVAASGGDLIACAGDEEHPPQYKSQRPRFAGAFALCHAVADRHTLSRARTE